MALRDWLPKVIQSLRPWMSAADIEKGTRWSADIARRLEEAKVGLICLTPDNLGAPWIMFEAGAISKTLEGTYVIPYLFEVTPSQMEGPLTQFQAVKAEKDDTKELILTINRALGDDALPELQLTESFDVWWPQLRESLLAVPTMEAEEPPRRSDREILEEILSLTRLQSRSGSHYPVVPRTPTVGEIMPSFPDGVVSMTKVGDKTVYTLDDRFAFSNAPGIPVSDLNLIEMILSERRKENARRHSSTEHEDIVVDAEGNGGNSS